MHREAQGDKYFVQSEKITLENHHLDTLGIGQFKIQNLKVFEKNNALNHFIQECQFDQRKFNILKNQAQDLVSMKEILEIHMEANCGNSTYFVKYQSLDEALVYCQIDIFAVKTFYQVYIKDVTKAINIQKTLSDDLYQDAIESNFSHQQMTPINNIMNNANLVLKQVQMIKNSSISNNEKFKKLQKFMNWSQDATTQILQSSQILHFYNRCQLLKMKIRQGKNMVEPRSIKAPEDEIRKVLQPFQYFINDLSLDIKIERHGAPFQKHLTTDWDYYQLVLFNVLKNAVKHNVKGGQITVQLEISEKVLKTLVTDTGKGIEPQAQKFMFKQFAEINAKQERVRDRDQGIGNGLTCSKTIAEAIGGDINLIGSKKGKTQIRILIPIQQDDHVPPRKFRRSQKSLGESFKMFPVQKMESTSNKESLENLLELNLVIESSQVNSGGGVSLINKSILDQNLKRDNILKSQQKIIENQENNINDLLQKPALFKDDSVCDLDDQSIDENFILNEYQRNFRPTASRGVSFSVNTSQQDLSRNCQSQSLIIQQEEIPNPMSVKISEELQQNQLNIEIYLEKSQQRQRQRMRSLHIMKNSQQSIFRLHQQEEQKCQIDSSQVHQCRNMNKFLLLPGERHEALPYEIDSMPVISAGGLHNYHESFQYKSQIVEGNPSIPEDNFTNKFVSILDKPQVGNVLKPIREESKSEVEVLSSSKKK